MIIVGFSISGRLGVTRDVPHRPPSRLLDALLSAEDDHLQDCHGRIWGAIQLPAGAIKHLRQNGGYTARLAYTGRLSALVHPLGPLLHSDTHVSCLVAFRTAAYGLPEDSEQRDLPGACEYAV